MPLSADNPEIIHPNVIAIWKKIDNYFVEEIKPVRRVMKKLDKSIDIDSMTFHLVNEHHKPDLDAFDLCVSEGKDMALMSDAGTVAVADPGHEIVLYAHDRNIQVIPIASPSSILLALMASGLNGNRFAFRGYLHRQENERKKQLKAIESRILEHNETTLVMDAPYRNNKLLESILKNMNPKIALSISTELTSDREMIKTRSIADWQKSVPDLHKKKVMFVLGRFD